MNIIDIRRALHQIPELGRSEYKTKEYILNVAKNLNCKIYTPTKTAVVLYFDKGLKSTLCFRSDMDALPITEANDIPYKSVHAGIMHACAHDGHMAMLLSFAIWASDNLDKLKHNIVCLFQPSEEDNAGANDIIKSNILNDLKIDAIFGFHIWPNLEMGKIFSMPNGMLASSAEVTIDIEGLSFHAANKRNDIDAITKSFNIINSFYDFARNIKEPHLINFGKISAGSARNVVAGSSHIEATLRAFDDETFYKLKEKLVELVKKEEDRDFKTKININWAYPSVLNDIDLFNKYKDLLNINILNKPFLQAEDFGCYTRIYKSLFMLLGCGNTPFLHSCNFNFNEDILEVGTNTYIKIATN